MRQLFLKRVPDVTPVNELIPDETYVFYEKADNKLGYQIIESTVHRRHNDAVIVHYVKYKWGFIPLNQYISTSKIELVRPPMRYYGVDFKHGIPEVEKVYTFKSNKHNPLLSTDSKFHYNLYTGRLLGYDADDNFVIQSADGKTLILDRNFINTHRIRSGKSVPEIHSAKSARFWFKKGEKKRNGIYYIDGFTPEGDVLVRRFYDDAPADKEVSIIKWQDVRKTEL